MPLEPGSPRFRPDQQLTQAAMNRHQRDVHNTARDYAQNFRAPRNPLAGLPGFTDSFVGVVLSGPPSGQASGSGGDYADARYWVGRCVPQQSMAAGDLFATAVEAIPNLAQTVTATNLAELPADGSAGTHGVPAGTRVHVFRFRTRETEGSPGVDSHVFTWGGAGGVRLVRLSGGGGGGGSRAYDVYDYFTNRQLGANCPVLAPRAIADDAGLPASLGLAVGGDAFHAGSGSSSSGAASGNCLLIWAFETYLTETDCEVGYDPGSGGAASGS